MPVVRIVLGQAKTLGWIALGTILACDGGGGPRAEPATDRVPTATAAINERDLNAYDAGTRAQIAVLQHAVQAGRPVDVGGTDSAGAKAAGMSLDQFRATRIAVEASLKSQSVLASRAPRLDSLRVELMVLRVRIEATP